MLQKILSAVLVLSLILFGLLIISLFVTTPDQLGPFGITLWFVALFIATSGLLTTLVYVFGPKKNQTAYMSSARRGILLGLWLTSMLALASLRQLDVRDIILVTILVLLVDFYIRRTR